MLTARAGTRVTGSIRIGEILLLGRPQTSRHNVSGVNGPGMTLNICEVSKSDVLVHTSLPCGQFQRTSGCTLSIAPTLLLGGCFAFRYCEHRCITPQCTASHDASTAHLVIYSGACLLFSFECTPCPSVHGRTTQLMHPLDELSCRACCPASRCQCPLLNQALRCPILLLLCQKTQGLTLFLQTRFVTLSVQILPYIWMHTA